MVFAPPTSISDFILPPYSSFFWHNLTSILKRWILSNWHCKSFFCINKNKYVVLGWVLCYFSDRAFTKSVPVFLPSSLISAYSHPYCSLQEMTKTPSQPSYPRNGNVSLTAWDACSRHYGSGIESFQLILCSIFKIENEIYFFSIDLAYL